MNEKINIYLDDLRVCPEGFKIARTYDEAVNILESSKVGIISLDHDLGSDQEGNLLKTGYDLVKYICENNCDIEKIYIHTDNVVGRDNMYKTLIGARDRGFISEDMEIYYYPLVPNRWEPTE